MWLEVLIILMTPNNPNKVPALLRFEETRVAELKKQARNAARPRKDEVNAERKTREGMVPL
jgi:hypothetical protein